MDTQSKVGYGAYLAVSETDVSLSELKQRVKIKRFEQTSSTRLELQTLLWALGDISLLNHHITIYTDSQNIIGLPARRHRLEQNKYHSSQGKLLKNYLLYQQFYQWTDQFDCQLIKVTGHQPTTQKETLDQFFSLVDKASRKALREDLRHREDG
ncbi:RNase H [Desulfuromusa kysingii]|uniref:RNase H n=1 Tax=Desulfuromusa kysingii TaxID=37625 RepID=A0A1H3X796_9BACT|nr:RNase H [Desulfuromusa kysingii]